jgi:DNA repair protein RadD
MDSGKGISLSLKEELASLGVSALIEVIDSDLITRLQENGVEINASILADIVISDKGIDAFKYPNLRQSLLEKYGIACINKKLGLDLSRTSDLISFNNFRWGKNQKSKSFLSLLSINHDINDDRAVHSLDMQYVLPDKTLHAYQNWIRKKIFNFLTRSAKSKTIVHMPTGSGKTRTSLEAVCDYVRSLDDSSVAIVWFAHSEELCEQAAESFASVWERLGSQKATIVRLWGGRNPVIDQIETPTFVVSSFQTAYKLQSSSSDERFALFAKIRRKCVVLIVDEAHQSIAPTYQQAIDLFSNRNTKIVGLTATPGRHHVHGSPEETLRLSNYYDNNKIDIVDNNGAPLDDPISFLTSEGILSKVKQYQIRSMSDIILSEAEIQSIERHLDIPSSVLRRLGENSYRTNLIATNCLKLALELNLQTIVFAPSKSNAIELALLFATRGCSSAAITGDTERARRQELIRDFKQGKIKILVNFGVLTTGFDAPNIGAVVIARPTTSVVLYSQMIGRGLRGPKMGGSEECVTVDVIDNIRNMPSAAHAFTYFNEYFNAGSL